MKSLFLILIVLPIVAIIYLIAIVAEGLLLIASYARKSLL
jgi:hypothetical protein